MEAKPVIHAPNEVHLVLSKEEFALIKNSLDLFKVSTVMYPERAKIVSSLNAKFGYSFPEKKTNNLVGEEGIKHAPNVYDPIS